MGKERVSGKPKLGEMVLDKVVLQVRKSATPLRKKGIVLTRRSASVSPDSIISTILICSPSLVGVLVGAWASVELGVELELNPRSSSS